MYRRLLAAGAKGMYVPELIIYHYIHPDRLTKKYFRAWHFWRGVSSGVMDRRQPQATPYLLGIPRFLFGRVGRGLGRISGRMLHPKNNKPEMFAYELQIWDLAGFFYGKHWYKAKDI
jgi:GT2 family glycosyltransferase